MNKSSKNYATVCFNPQYTGVAEELKVLKQKEKSLRQYKAKKEQLLRQLIKQRERVSSLEYEVACLDKQLINYNHPKLQNPIEDNE
jgi:transposase